VRLRRILRSVDKAQIFSIAIKFWTLPSVVGVVEEVIVEARKSRNWPTMYECLAYEQWLLR